MNNLFFGDQDYKFFSAIIDERTRLFGTDGFYLRLSDRQEVDPYYQEPIKMKFVVDKIPIKLFVAVQRIEEPIITDRGLQQDSTIEAFISATELRKNAIQPQEGDVIEIWDKQFDAVNIEPIQIFGNKGINILNQPNSLYWRFTLIRRIEFIAERRVVINE